MKEQKKEQDAKKVLLNGKETELSNEPKKSKSRKKLATGVLVSVILALLVVSSILFVNYCKAMSGNILREIADIEVTLEVTEAPELVREELREVRRHRKFMLFAPADEKALVNALIKRIDDKIALLDCKGSDWYLSYANYTDIMQELGEITENNKNQKISGDSNEPSYKSNEQQVTIDNNGANVDSGLSIDEPTPTTDVATGQPISAGSADK